MKCIYILYYFFIFYILFYRKNIYTIKISNFQFIPKHLNIPPKSIIRWYVDPSFNEQDDEFLIIGNFNCINNENNFSIN